MRFSEKSDLYNLILTVTSASYVGKAWNIKQLSTGHWCMDFLIRIVRTGSAITQYSIDVEGVHFGPDYQTCACYADTGAEAPNGLHVIIGALGTNQIDIFHASNDTNGYTLTGNVLMTAKPDWFVE